MLIIHDLTINSYTKEKRKTLSLRIGPKGEISLKAPLHASEAEVHDFVLRKKAWINKKLAHFAQFEHLPTGPLSERAYILYLGKEYDLIKHESSTKNEVKLEPNSLILYTSKPNNTRHNERILSRWLLSLAELVFHERLSQILLNFPEIARPVLKIRKYKGRWGSYASNHVMTLNSVLIHAGIDAIDYIITHELCHYYHKGHGADFYALLTEKMPTWKEVKKSLHNGQVSML